MTSGDSDDRVTLRRFGLNFDPPSLVLEYERTTSGRLFHRRIGLRRLGPTADPSRTAEKIRRQNKALLAEDQVPFEQLVSVVARLQARQNEQAAKAVAAVSSPTPALAPKSVSPREASAEEASPPKAAIEAAAAEEASSPKPSEESAAEEDSADEASTPPAPAAEAGKAAAIPVVEDDLSDLDLPDLDGELNLNLLSTEELDTFKRRMDVDFAKTQVKPGDSSFQYDIRIDHVIDEDADSCGWDDSDVEEG